MTNKILLVEDDLSLAKGLQQIFQKHGWRVSLSHTLEKSYQLLDQELFDLAIIDRVLPDGNGLEIVEYLHDCFFKIKVLLLTSQSAQKQKIEGLKSGADDYLAKPFNSQELILRIKRLLATEKLRQTQTITIGKLTLQPKSGQLTINKKQITLRKKEASILKCFMRYHNQVVTKDMLLDYVWGNNKEIPSFITIGVYIRRIRKLLGKKVVQIKTIRGLGYQLQVAVSNS